MRRVIVHEKRRVFDGFFKIDEAMVSYEAFDGGMIGPVRRLVFERGDSAAALVYHRDRQRVILASQFRYPSYDKGPGWMTEALAGVIDPGETPEECVRREVREESGYEVDQLERIASFYLSPGGSSERIVLYYAEVTDGRRVGAGGGIRSDGEDIRLVELSVPELEAAIAAGEIVDAKTLVGAAWLLRRRAAG